jgi:hypothetical protein
MPTEDNATQPIPALDWSAELARQIEAEQQRLTLLFDGQRQQVDGLEAVLAAQLGALAGHLASSLGVEDQPAGERSPAHCSEPDAARWAEQLQRVETERDELVRKLVGLEQRLHSASSDPGLNQEAQQLQRRLERAVREAQALKLRNAELEQQAATPGKAPAAAPDGPLDWEAQKRILLAALEAEAPTQEKRCQEHLTIDGTIRITDTIVQEKDREITELKQLLTEQCQSVGTVAVGAAALGGILDSDEIIRQQRERLAQLQAEWEEKMRRAEIDISMERAKLARERADLEEGRRSLEDQLQIRRPSAADNGDATNPASPPRGRWLSRLGLRDNG